MFGVCLFLGVHNSRQNKKIGKRGVPEKKNGGNEWTGPPNEGTFIPKFVFNFNEKSRNLVDVANGILPTCSDAEKTIKILTR